jgi:urease accessory protein
VTHIGVQAAPGRARLTLTGGPISPRLLRVRENGARIGLVATTALLLGGDHVDIEIDVGPGAWLELVETAGTVAYDANGLASSWTVRIRVADDGLLIWAGEPFVVAHGANVQRDTSIELGAGSVACLRETLVLGRTGETGGAIRSTLSVRQCGSELLIEDLDLRDPAIRVLPGLIGDARVLDTVALLGINAPPTPELLAGTRFELDGAGTLARCLTTTFAASPLAPVSAAWQMAAHDRPVFRAHEKAVAAATTS